MKRRILELCGVLTAAACVCGLVLVVSPRANADPLSAQNATIMGDRAKYGSACAPLKLNQTLQSMAEDAVFQYHGPEGGLSGSFGSDPPDPAASRYAGQIRFFPGTGDPESDALTNAYKRGAGNMLSNCDFTEFASGFYRDDNAGSENDAVMIIFGKPASAAPAGPPAPAGPAAPAAQAAPAPPVAVPPTTCPAGSKTATVDPPAQCEGPTNAISMNITQDGLNADVAVTNNSALPADCAYTATKTAGLLGPPTVTRSLSVDPNSTGNITDLLWPPPFVSYHAMVKCTATYNGKKVTIGESTQDVSG